MVRLARDIGPARWCRHLHGLLSVYPTNGQYHVKFRKALLGGAHGTVCVGTATIAFLLLGQGTIPALKIIWIVRPVGMRFIKGARVD
eukprot:scaffold1640_cov161-Amphora_coffeaeformis.AAC.5